VKCSLYILEYCKNEHIWSVACLRTQTPKGHFGASLLYSINCYIYLLCGPGSSVGIATDYGMDGPGSNPGGDEIFCPSRPALGPIQPPAKWVPCLSRG